MPGVVFVRGSGPRIFQGGRVQAFGELFLQDKNRADAPRAQAGADRQGRVFLRARTVPRFRRRRSRDELCRRGQPGKTGARHIARPRHGNGLAPSLGDAHASRKRGAVQGNRRRRCGLRNARRVFAAREASRQRGGHTDIRAHNNKGDILAPAGRASRRTRSRILHARNAEQPHNARPWIG